MGDTSTPDGSSDFRRQVQEILRDPKVIAFAVRRARNPDLADDALQSAYLHIISVEHPENIRNLRSYCFTTVANEIRALYTLPRPVLVDDVETITAPQPSLALYGPVCERSVADQACTTAQAQVWLTRHAGLRGSSPATVPGRSARPRPIPRGHPRRRETGSPRPAQPGPVATLPSPMVLGVAYPPPTSPTRPPLPNTLHQRISRARDDIKALLRSIVNRDELS